VNVDVTRRRESARLAESIRRLAWMIDGLHARAHDLYEGMTPGELQGFDGDLEDILEECHALRRQVEATWNQVTARTEIPELEDAA
jgi:hypothetical protein